MRDRTTIFGRTPEGDVVECHALEAANGFSVSVLTFGGRLCSIQAPDRDGRLGEILLGFGTLEPYLTDDQYFGAMIGRYANRIPGGRFSLDGVDYSLSLNDEKWTLHGGKRGFDKVLWSAAPTVRPQELILTHSSAHLDQGFPGTLQVTLSYRVEPPSTLRIDYEAVTDRPTVVNFTHHPYFNLAGAGSGTVREHIVAIDADAYLVLDGMLPSGKIAPVRNTALDFRAPMSIGRDLGRGLASVGGGYDHTYDLRALPVSGPANLRRAARIMDPGSGRALEVITNQPGMQFYTGNQLDGSKRGRGGAYEKFGSFTFEPEQFPDSVHHADFPSTRLNPGEHYHTTSLFVFSTE